MRRVCGISIVGGSAIFVVLEGNRDNFTIIDTMFKKIDLDDDSDQNQIKSFFTAVEDFLKQNRINSVFIKKSNTSGKYSAGSKSFKIEALIQLMQYPVKLVPSQTLAAFLKKNEIPTDITSLVFKYQEDALRLGFYALGV